MTKKYARFNVHRVRRDPRFGTVESGKEYLTKFFGMTKESGVFGKCIGREGASKVTDCNFEKARKMIRL